MKGCRMEAESPERSEDLQRTAGTAADSTTGDESPSFLFAFSLNHTYASFLCQMASTDRRSKRNAF